jgi:hypothetical protein
MKPLKIILPICVVGVIIVGLFFWLGKPAFVTQKADTLDKVYVLFEPDYPDKETVVHITDPLEIQRVYELLQGTKKNRANKYPSHDRSMQADAKFAVCFEYQNGEKDIFRATEQSGFIFRFLDTKGNNGDPGYITGENERLWEYVSTLKEN